jgi:hypothetical protein
MDDKKSSDSSDYVVGYGRPPKSKRFVAGKSGNPKGRRKGSRLVGAILRDIIEQKIAVTENGKTRRMPVLEVTFRRLANDAMRSDPRAVKLLLSLIERYAASPETMVQLDAVLAEDRAILGQYLQKKRYRTRRCPHLAVEEGQIRHDQDFGVRRAAQSRTRGL